MTVEIGDKAPQVSEATFNALSDVAPASFWGPYRSTGTEDQGSGSVAPHPTALPTPAKPASPVPPAPQSTPGAEVTLMSQ